MAWMESPEFQELERRIQSFLEGKTPFTPIEDLFLKNQVAFSQSLASLQEVESHLLGKNSILVSHRKTMGKLSPEEKAVLGQRIQQCQTLFQKTLQSLSQKIQHQMMLDRLLEERVDISRPAPEVWESYRHPLTAIAEDFLAILESMGFRILEGDELTSPFYNFDALNIPIYHPGRSLQDTLYIRENLLLRTQTSGMQIHILEQYQPPLALASPGKCFRRDETDKTHLPAFHQIEGLCIQENLSFQDLKNCITYLLHLFFDSSIQVFFKPDFFPFTEPSVEIAILCPHCKGEKASCTICRGSGEIEIAGCGMVHPLVLERMNVDTQRYSGFAFGFGIERLAMLKYQVSDIRHFYENHPDFLAQKY